MKRRMLDGGIWANAKFAELPCMARLLQIGLINLADDQGRMIAHPSFLRSQIFPYDEDVTGSDIRNWLAAIVANGTATIYEVDGKDYIQLLKWWDYQSLQYATPSEHPRPEGWHDRIRYNAKGGMTLTCNWVTPRGETPTDTCDEDGNPLPIVASLPPRNPGGRPPQNPGGNTNKEQIKININKEGDRARVTEPVRAEPEIPPPSSSTNGYRSEPLPNEYIPGVPLPRWSQAKRNADHFTVEAQKHNVGAEPFRLMVDLVLDATGKTSLANTNSPKGQETLNAAKQTVVTLLEMNRKCVEDIREILTSWRENDWRGKSSPTFDQIVEHASAMDAGTHVTARRQDSNKKEFASFQDYNEWAARHDPEYKRIKEGVLIRGTTVKRPNYRPVVTH